MVAGGLEHCFICNSKVMIENESSMEKHNEEEHDEELRELRFSNNMKDVIRTVCQLCNVTYPVSRMRMHTKQSHGIPVSEYKKKFNIASDRDYELVEKILHKCGICGLNLLLCSDVIAVHIKRHKVTHANYNATFMNLMQGTSGAVKNKTEFKRQNKKEISEPSGVAVPFSPSMLMSDVELGLNLFSPVDASEVQDQDNKDPLSLEATLEEDGANDANEDVINDADYDKPSNLKLFVKKVHESPNMEPKSKKIKLSDDVRFNFHKSLKSKFSKIKSSTENRSVGGDIENSSEFSNLMDRILGNFAANPGDENQRDIPDVPHISSNQNLDELIANIWD